MLSNIFDTNDYQEIGSRLGLVRVAPHEFEIQGEDCMYYMSENRIRKAVEVFTAALDIIERNKSC